jgi:hypothetical protein
MKLSPMIAECSFIAALRWMEQQSNTIHDNSAPSCPTVLFVALKYKGKPRQSCWDPIRVDRGHGLGTVFPGSADAAAAPLRSDRKQRVNEQPMNNTMKFWWPVGSRNGANKPFNTCFERFPGHITSHNIRLDILG